MIRFVMIGCLAAMIGCVAEGPRRHAPASAPSTDGGTLYIGTAAQGWEEIVRANPLGPKDNIKGVVLSSQPAVSHFLVQIRDREQPHIHRTHEATVVMLRGRGRLVLQDRILSMRVGDAVLIPRGATHYYVNDAPEPTVVLAIFTPSYDGTDADVVPFEDRPDGAP
ncbi:MAG: cupin domain-containing protein [Nitrospirota bacterium]